MEMFDPLTNKWMMKASMNTKRCRKHFESSDYDTGFRFQVISDFKEKCFFRRGIALAALGGPIYAIGGLDDNSCFNDVERYDIESDSWSAVAPMNTPRGGVGSVALGVRQQSQPSKGDSCIYSSLNSFYQNFVYAVGGNDGVASLSSVERFNPHLNKWMEVREMGQRRAGNGVSKLNGCLYVVGERKENLYLFVLAGHYSVVNC